MKFGKFEINVLQDGYFKLDGGAMFGIVPKVIWDRLEPSDDMNRILMSVNPLLIRTGEHTVLIDTGLGSKYDSRKLEIYQIELPRGLIAELHRLELEPEQVDVVINSHLHFDHIGGNSFRDVNGELKPTFPNAKYFMQKGEYEEALNPNSRSSASYNKEDVLPLQEAGLITLIDGDVEIIPGIRSRVTGGHTTHHQIIEIESEGEKGFFLADLIPTSSHIRVPYVMGYDLFPADTAAFKEQLLQEAAEGSHLLFFEHSPRVKVGRVRLYEGGLDFFAEAYD